jgi:xylan 1,4-beta-xylosidase
VLLAVVVVALIAACGSSGTVRPTYTNPIVAGQYPDPTVIRDDGDYYLAATTRAWVPAFSLFHSRDLVNWTRIGAVLPQAPLWTAGRFWAPEFTRWGPATRVYYTALSRSQIHCIGVALANAPAGPYQDLGRPLYCPASGAIDSVVADDGHGARYLVYRRFDKPGGIWAIRLSRDGLHVDGRPHELLKATAADHGVVEGPEIVRHGGFNYLLFAASNCCRPPCDYFEGVARSRSLLGPYERARRPALVGTKALRCPGHGTVVTDANAQSWFLHHAVLPDDPVNARRQPVLDPLRWAPDGWPVLGDNGLPMTRAAAPLGVQQRAAVTQAPDLVKTTLDPSWEWPWNRTAFARPSSDGLMLRGDPRTAELARQVAPLDVRAQVKVEAHGCAAGLAGVEGGEDVGEAIGIEVARGQVRVWRGVAGPGVTVATTSVARGAPITLLATVRGSRTMRFAIDTGGGPVAVGPAVSTPPTPRILRLALTCRGPRSSRAIFRDLRIAAGR